MQNAECRIQNYKVFNFVKRVEKVLFYSMMLIKYAWVKPMRFGLCFLEFVADDVFAGVLGIAVRESYGNSE